MNCPKPDLLARCVAGLLTPDDRRSVETHLVECAACADQVTALRATASRLALDEDERAGEPFLEDVMTLVRLRNSATSPVRREPRQWFRLIAWPAAALATAGVLLMLNSPGVPPEPTGFQARGSSVADNQRWIALQVFRATASGYLPVQDQINVTDSLAFSYLNHGPAPFAFLAVVAIDEGGRIFWYYPAVGATSAGVPIGLASQPVALPDQVQHDLRPGPLAITAIFSRQPLAAASIEAALRERGVPAPSAASLLALGDVGQQTWTVQVVDPGNAIRP